MGVLVVYAMVVVQVACGIGVYYDGTGGVSFVVVVQMIWWCDGSWWGW